MDAFLSSASMEPADGASHYREPLHHLANLSIAYPYPPDADQAAEKNGEGPPLYVCMQNLIKLLPRFDRLAARIAAGAGPCRFVFFEHASAAVTARFRARLARAFRAEGLDLDAVTEFHPITTRDAYFAFNKRADVLLDSLFWSGGKTSLDAFACNRPVVTLAGPMMRGRHTAAMLTLMGVEELIAHSEDDYVEIAARLGRDRAWRRDISERIAANKHHLFDDEAPVRALERFLLERSGRS
jgi:predicted O-linked N-acetylglucosamine transferase (SPINDLY family)